MKTKKSAREILDTDEMILVNKGVFMLSLKTVMDHFMLGGVPANDIADMITGAIAKSNLPLSFMEDFSEFLIAVKEDEEEEEYE